MDATPTVEPALQQEALQEYVSLKLKCFMKHSQNYSLDEYFLGYRNMQEETTATKNMQIGYIFVPMLSLCMNVLQS
jgi:hypothetical protein